MLRTWFLGSRLSSGGAGRSSFGVTMISEAGHEVVVDSSVITESSVAACGRRDLLLIAGCIPGDERRLLPMLGFFKFRLYKVV